MVGDLFFPRKTTARWRQLLQSFVALARLSIADCERTHARNRAKVNSNGRTQFPTLVVSAIVDDARAMHRVANSRGKTVLAPVAEQATAAIEVARVAGEVLVFICECVAWFLL